MELQKCPNSQGSPDLECNRLEPQEKGLEEMIKRAEERRDEAAGAEDWDNVRYWVGYLDGLRAAERHG